MAGRLTDALRARILELHAEGTARNEIARQTGVSAGSVTNVVHDAGLTFERFPEVQAGVEARVIDLRARRAAFQVDLQTYVEELLRRARGSQHTVILKGSYGAESEEVVNVLPSREVKDLTSAITSNVAAMVRLATLDSGREADGAKSMLAGVQEQLQAYATTEADDGQAPA